MGGVLSVEAGYELAAEEAEKRKSRKKADKAGQANLIRTCLKYRRSRDLLAGFRSQSWVSKCL